MSVGSRWPAAAVWAAPAAAACLFALWIPSDNDAAAICPFRRFTGHACPGCGLTRGIAHLARGDWTAAVAYHPLAPLIAAELVIGWLAWVVHRLGVSRLTGMRTVVMATAVAHVPLFLAVWAFRRHTGAIDLVG